jgi:hypothetical protein
MVYFEKYESQWEGLSHILWTNKSHVPKQQPIISEIVEPMW